MGSYSAPGGAGVREAAVDFVGDGSDDRLIEIGFTPKMYAYFRRQDGLPLVDNHFIVDHGGPWSLVVTPSYSTAENRTFISGTKINVGLLRTWVGGNDSGVDYRIIAFA